MDEIFETNETSTEVEVVENPTPTDEETTEMGLGNALIHLGVTALTVTGAVVVAKKAAGGVKKLFGKLFGKKKGEAEAEGCCEEVYFED